MAIVLNDNIDTRAPKPTDNRFGPYATTAAALANIPEYQRYVGLTVGVGTPIVEWWFDSSLTLVLKTTSGTVTGITAGSGINITGTSSNPTISITTPAQLTTNISTDVITDQASNVKYPSVKATKAYVDANVAGLLDDRGNFSATTGSYPISGGSGPLGAIRKGDLWFISVAGTLNGNAVGIGASVRALVDDAQPNNDAQWDILDTGLGFIPESVNNKVTNGSSITSDPTSITKYASLSALTEYIASIPASTPTLQQVLANTPSQTSTGYDINLQTSGGNLTTNVGQGQISVTNISAGKSITATTTKITIASTTTTAVYASNSIQFSNSVSGTLTLESVPNNNTLVLPNQNATLIASVNNSIFADSLTGNITIPYVGGTGTQNYVTKWNADGISLTNSVIYDNGTNVGIGTTTPAYKLDVNGTGRFVNDLYADEDFIVNNYFAIDTTATAFPIPNGNLGIWRRKGNGFGTYFLEDEQGGAKDKWAFVKRQGYNQIRDWFQTNSSIVDINYGWGNPNSSNYEGATLLIDPTINITDVAQTGTIVRGIYYNPTLTSLTNTTHIAFENRSGDNYLNSSSGNTLIGYSTPPLTPFKLEVNGEISTVTGVRIAGNRSKTGIYPYDAFGGGLDFYAANNILATFRLTNPGGQHYLFDAAHTYDNSLSQLPTASMVIKGSVSPTGPNSVPITQLLINPTYAQTPSGIPRGTGTLRGIYYAPTVTSLNTSAHVAFENTSGDILLGTTSGRVGIATSTPNVATKLDVNGFCHIGTGSPSVYIGAGHTMEITASGLSVPLTTIGGSSILEVWSDATRSNGAVSYGAAFPGATPDGNIHFATFISSEWKDRIIVDKTEGRVRIGAGNFTAVSSALLEVNSTTKGFLPPKMTQTERLAIVSPAEGLIVYDTTNSALGVYSSGGWRKLSMEEF